MLEVIRFRKKKDMPTISHRNLWHQIVIWCDFCQRPHLYIFLKLLLYCFLETQFTLSDKTQTFWKKRPTWVKIVTCRKLIVGIALIWREGKKEVFKREITSLTQDFTAKIIIKFLCLGSVLHTDVKCYF